MLDIEQILFLWDRIIGFDSLELIPIAAICIFLYKKESLLQISSANELKVIIIIYIIYINIYKYIIISLINKIKHFLLLI